MREHEGEVAEQQQEPVVDDLGHRGGVVHHERGGARADQQGHEHPHERGGQESFPDRRSCPRPGRHPRACWAPVAGLAGGDRLRLTVLVRSVGVVVEHVGSLSSGRPPGPACAQSSERLQAVLGTDVLRRDADRPPLMAGTGAASSAASAARARTHSRSATRLSQGTSQSPGSCPVRRSAMTRRSARRAVARATSSAADARVWPGTTNSRGISIRDSQVARSSSTRTSIDSSTRVTPSWSRSAAAGIRGQLGARHEHLPLEPQDERGELGRGRRGYPGAQLRSGAAKSCHGFIDGAVGLDDEVVLGNPAAVQQPCGAVIAATRGHGTVSDARPASSCRRAHRLTTSGRRRAGPSARPAGSPCSRAPRPPRPPP